nr:MAG TPA: hypothetical protein [Caudoviricetes sp.]
MLNALGIRLHLPKNKLITDWTRVTTFSTKWFFKVN